MILRDKYLKTLVSWKGKEPIKVITGVRRCGKSTLLDLFKEELLQSKVAQEQIIALKLDDLDGPQFSDYQELHSYISKKLIPTKMNYVLLDEVQLIDEFQRAVESLNLKKNVDLYITGSNSSILSSDLATLLSGRFVEIAMFPLSFKEFVGSQSTKNSQHAQNLSSLYRHYLQYGSFPYVAHLDADAEHIQAYLEGLINTVLIKDVVARHKIANTTQLLQVVRYLFGNPGNQSSMKRISDTMTSAGNKISSHTVDTYLAALEASYLVYPAKCYDIKGRQLLKNSHKHYVVDTGLSFALLGQKAAGAGHLLENVVYLELLRRPGNVYVGKIGNKEVDFVVENTKGTTYYQVALTVREQQTLERELAPLRSIPDFNRRVLLTLDDDPPISHNGIKQLNALEWLLNEDAG